MPYQSTRNLTAFIMGDAFKEAVNWSPSLMGLVRFGGLRLELYRLIQLCLKGYIKGAAIGYTFRDKYDLVVPLMIKPDKAPKHTENLIRASQKRIDSYGKERTSIIDFFVATELDDENLSFDDFIEKAKKKVKIDSAAPTLKQTFEEATAFGATQPEIITKVISPTCRTSSFDWEQAKLNGIEFDINSIELDLNFLKKWAVHNMGLYCRESAPELIAPLGL